MKSRSSVFETAIANAEDDARFGPLDEGFTADSTVAELATWWLQNVARHRVRDTTFATYRKQVQLIDAGLGPIPASQLLTPAETRRLLAECDGRFDAAVGLCYLQGVRLWWLCHPSRRCVSSYRRDRVG